MKPKTKWSLVLIVAAAMLSGGLTTTLLAQPFGEGEPGADLEEIQPPPEELGPRGLIRQLVHLHMQLGRYYLMDGDYQQAKTHFLAVAEYQPPEILEQEGIEHRGARVVRARRGAYLMAAVATYLMGDPDSAIALAQTAQSLTIPEPPARAGRRGPAGRHGPGMRPHGARGQGRRWGQHRGEGPRGGGDPVEAFIENPEEFVERFANGPLTLEERILEIEAELSENVGQ